jgi:hypothetical protein
MLHQLLQLFFGNRQWVGYWAAVASHTCAVEYKSGSRKVRKNFTLSKIVFRTYGLADLRTICTSVRRNNCCYEILPLVIKLSNDKSETANCCYFAA